QLTVPSRSTSKISSALHQKLIAKYDECWVPDVPGPINLSGKLGHLRNTHLPIQHIGPLSRMSPLNLEIKYDILCLLSGPEPQRSMLEKKLRNELAGSDKRIAIVQGVVEGGSNCTKEAQFTVFNYLQTEALEKLINQSTMVISRPGYTTIMDLAQMQKPAFFIPTPGQSEQQYLAKKLRRQGLVPSCSQRKFNLRQLRKSTVYKGLYAFKKREDFSDLFRLFEGKGELRAYA
ncbi:MAG: glycosyltransferase, partial [Marinirhabdus sp.]|nr:glycosyltransferase [Marinirhabdus sp.]